MAKRIRRILVALGDVGRVPAAELRKAGALARASGASIELFHALAEPSLGEAGQTKTKPGQGAAFAAPIARMVMESVLRD